MSSAVKSVGGALGFGSAPKIGVPGAVKQARIREEEQKRFAKQQEEQLSPLRAQASGRAPSLAEAQMKAAQDRSLAQQVASARSGRGGSAAATQRNLARSQAQAGTQLAQQAAMAKLQEQQAAQGALRDELSRQRQQNLALEQARSSALLGQGSAITGVQQSNRAAQMQQQGRLTQLLGGAAGAFLASDKDNKKKVKDEGPTKKEKGAKFAKSLMQSGSEDQEKSKAAEQRAVNTAQAGVERARAALSDKDKKKKVSKEKDFLNKLNAYSFEYKDPEAPGAQPGRQVGIMAQDAEKSEMGKSFVMDTPSGKMLDMQKGFGAILAAQANLNKRLDQIEKKKKKKE